MKILVENGSHTVLNLGDVGMLQVAVSRLSELWPDASLYVTTASQDRLAFYCQGTIPVPAQGLRVWSQQMRYREGGAHFLTRRAVRRRMSALARLVGLRRANPFRRPMPGYVDPQFARARDMDLYVNTLKNVDLLILGGGGYINSIFTTFAHKVLDVVATAARRGVVTVMVGQGIGPVADRQLWDRAKQVLPRVDLICIRERRTSMPLLKSLGVSSDRVLTTGDDSLELAFAGRTRHPGHGIGINVRHTAYSEVGPEDLSAVRKAIHLAAARYGAPLIPVPISFHNFGEDANTIRDALGVPNDPRKIAAPWTPKDIIEQIGSCRVVVTGSYHAGVFALGQGIPVVALAWSQYYAEKFFGLAHQFGGGCEVIHATDGSFSDRIESAISRAWEAADVLRPTLLDAAVEQIRSGRAAYAKIPGLVAMRHPRRSARNRSVGLAEVHHVG